MSISRATPESSGANVHDRSRHRISRVLLSLMSGEAPLGHGSSVRNPQWQPPQQDPADLVAEIELAFTATGV